MICLMESCSSVLALLLALFLPADEDGNLRLCCHRKWSLNSAWSLISLTRYLLYLSGMALKERSRSQIELFDLNASQSVSRTGSFRMQWLILSSFNTDVTCMPLTKDSQPSTAGLHLMIQSFLTFVEPVFAIFLPIPFKMWYMSLELWETFLEAMPSPAVGSGLPKSQMFLQTQRISLGVQKSEKMVMVSNLSISEAKSENTFESILVSLRKSTLYSIFAPFFSILIKTKFDSQTSLHQHLHLLSNFKEAWGNILCPSESLVNYLSLLLQVVFKFSFAKVLFMIIFQHLLP